MLAVTTDSKEAISAINRWIDQSLSYGKDAETAILEAIAADPTCAIAHAYAAAYYLSLENAIAWKQASVHVNLAQKYATKTTKREQMYVEAIAAWSDKKIERAIALHEEIASEFPQDLISVQQGQYHYFYLGDKERLLKIAEKVLPQNPEAKYLYGMIAFGLEQCNRLSQAEQMGRLATEINPQDPWAHHAVAHVMETQGRVDEGIAWMESLASTWENCNSMLYTHNWWHVALYYLERGDMKKVLELYDTKVWGKARKATPKDQVGAISLLLRLELRGVDVGDRWQKLAAYLPPRIHEHALPFQDLHYIYALARTGSYEAVSEMLTSMKKHAKTASQAWNEVAIPAAKGMIAHAFGDWSKTVDFLKPVLPKLSNIGGSHAQRQLFQQVYFDALQATSMLSRTNLISVHTSIAWKADEQLSS